MSRQEAKVRVLIPTTADLLDVLLLTEEDPAIGRSVACIGGSTRMAGIDADYNAFVARATGVVERLFGHPCYRLDVSGRIDAGSSWQLGVLTAHALRAAGRLAGEGEPAECILWATGSVRSVDLTVGGVDHVGEKLACSLDRLHREVKDGRSVLVVVPEANACQLAPELRTKLAALGIELIEVRTVETLWDRLHLSSPVLREQAERHRQLTLRTTLAVLMAALAFMAGIAAWTALRQSLEAERRLAIALEASSGITRTARDLTERFGMTAPQLSRRLQEADEVLQRLSSAQMPQMSLSEVRRTLQRLWQSIGDTPEFRYRKAQTLMALSENYGILGKTEAQLAHATAARGLLTELVGRKGAHLQWQRELARAYVAEGDALRSQGEDQAAFTAYAGALSLRTRLASEVQDPECLGELASSHGRIGEVLTERGDYDEALRRYDESLKLLERLVAREPSQSKWRRNMAAAHSKIGETRSSRGDAAGALRSFRESERIMTELVSADPNNTRWMRELGTCKERIADILLDRGDAGNALAGYQALLKLRQRLAASDPYHVLWQLDLAYAYTKVADALGVTDLKQALAMRREGHALVMRVASGTDPTVDVRRALSESHLNLGASLEKLGSTGLAGTHYQAALEQAEYLAISDPANAEWRDDLAVALERLGSNLGARGDVEGAHARLDRALRTRSELVVLYSGRSDWRRNMAIVQREMSLVLELRHDLDGALRLALDGLSSIEKLAAKDSASRGFQRELALSHRRVGELMLEKGERAEAIRHLDKALAIFDGDAEGGYEWLWDLVTVRTGLAKAFLADEQPRLAQEQLRRAKALAERLHPSESGYAPGIRALYTIHAYTSYIDQLRGNARRALAELRECQRLVAALVARDPENQAWKRDLALTQHSIGDVLAPLPGKRAEALTAYREAVRLLDPLSRSNPANMALHRTLVDAHRRIATLLVQKGDRDAELKALRAGRETAQRLATISPGDPELAENLAWFEETYRRGPGTK
jgi:tetratricopeptide (TPR) repeat protein